MAVQITVNAKQLAELSRGLRKVGILAAAGAGGLMPVLGETIVKQTQRRIKSTKKAPDGPRWKQNIRGTSRLFKTGALHSGIHHRSGRFYTIVSAPKLPYSAIHQFGGVIRPRRSGRLVYNVKGTTVFSKKSVIPQRQYMGLSSANLKELRVKINAFLGRAFGWLR